MQVPAGKFMVLSKKKKKKNSKIIRMNSAINLFVILFFNVSVSVMTTVFYSTISVLIYRIEYFDTICFSSQIVPKHFFLCESSIPILAFKFIYK